VTDVGDDGRQSDESGTYFARNVSTRSFGQIHLLLSLDALLLLLFILESESLPDEEDPYAFTFSSSAND
jgi:hypothetical protein